MSRIESLIVFALSLILYFVIGLWAIPVVILPFALYKYFDFMRDDAPTEDENADGTR